jgi:hypothetical protein
MHSCAGIRGTIATGALRLLKKCAPNSLPDSASPNGLNDFHSLMEESAHESATQSRSPHFALQGTPSRRRSHQSGRLDREVRHYLQSSGRRDAFVASLSALALVGMSKVVGGIPGGIAKLRHVPLCSLGLLERKDELVELARRREK